METCEEELKKLEDKIKIEEDRLEKLKSAIREIKRIQKELTQICEKDIEKENEEQLNQLLISLEKNIKTARYFLSKTNVKNNNNSEGLFCQEYIYYWNSKLYRRWNDAVREGILEDYPRIRPMF